MASIVKATKLTIRPVLDAPGTYYANWTWSVAKQTGHMDHVSMWWTYYTADGVSFVGDQKDVSPDSPDIIHPQYSPPSNAVKLNFWIKPVSKTYEKTENVKDKKGKVTGTRTVTKNYITVGAASVNYTIPGTIPVPEKPSAPTVTIDKTTLVAEVNTYDANTAYIQFQVAKNDTTITNTGLSRVVTNHAAFTCSVALGGEYKVRARGRGTANNNWGEWGEYSSNTSTIPGNPNRITRHEVLTPTSVRLYWNAVANTTAYDIEYTVDKSYFDISDNVQTVTTESGVTSRIIDSLESAQTWYFRIRATNSIGKSGWSSIYSVLLGSIPEPPTTWSDATSIVATDSVNLYWVHNSEDGSNQTQAQIEISARGRTATYTLSGDRISQEYGVASCYNFSAGLVIDETVKDSTNAAIQDSSGNDIGSRIVDYYDEGTVIEWRVRTKGVLNSPNSGYGNWSTKRQVVVYGAPIVELDVSQESNHSFALDTLSHFPIYIRANAYPSTQNVVGWSLKVLSNQAYITEDQVGQTKRVNNGAEMLSRYISATSNTLELQLSAGDIDLESTCEYTIVVEAAFNSGLTATSEWSFYVEWDDNEYVPDAEITIDDYGLLAYISPFCVYNNGVLIEDLLLSVYRREYDGTYRLIKDGIPNDLSITVTDPHPALDYARYRIVATSINTGEVGYIDMPDVPVKETAIVIQWDEKWDEFLREDNNPDTRMEEPWSGSVLKLPYNVSVSDDYDMDVNLTEYIGRSHPVSYYGTQRGVSGSWSTDIPRNDTETLFALRRLAIYPGNVYVREPSGVGYWARINVSLSKTYSDMLIPVTLDVTRVEGGI